jgi:hypothetical protein
VERRPVSPDRAVHLADRDHRLEHLGPVDQPPVARAAGGAALALLRHSFLQPAALHAPCRTDRDPQHGSFAARQSRVVAGLASRQGYRARARHAELRRQPRRRLLDARRHAPHPAARTRFRCRRFADRPDHRSSEERHLPHRRRRRPRHPGARHQDHAGHPARRPVAWLLRCAGLAGGADRQRGAGAEDALRHLPQGWPAIKVLDLSLQDYRDSAADIDPTVLAILKNRNPPRSSPSCAPASIRRHSSCGRSSATSFITPLSTSPTSPTTPATSISRCAGASAGRRVRSKAGRPPAGRRSPKPSRPTSTPVGR